MDAARGLLLGMSRIPSLVQRDGRACSATLAPHGRAETTFLVEDDERLRGMLRRTLSGHGYVVIEAGTATEALAGAARRSAPALVLTDVILPDGNGLDLARELTRTWRGARVTFMSGYAGDHLPTAESLPAGARFLPKPFTPEVLLAEVREAVRVRRPPAVHGEV